MGGQNGRVRRRRTGPALEELTRRRKRAWPLRRRHRRREPGPVAPLPRLPLRRRCRDCGMAGVRASGGGVAERLRGARSLEGSAPLRAVAARPDRTLARMQRRGSRTLAFGHGQSERSSPSPCASFAGAGRRKPLWRCLPPGRCLFPGARHGPLLWTALRLQRLPEGQAGMRDTWVRGRQIPAPA